MSHPVLRPLLGTVLLGLLVACHGDPLAPRDPQRILTLAPSVTEIAFALGLGDRIVGVGDYCRWPPEVESKPRLGGLFDPNLERIVRLEPDLAILLPSEGDLGEKLRRLGIDVLVVRNETLEDVEAAILDIARRCGVEAAGEKLLARLGQELKPLDLPGRPRVLLSIGRQPGQLSQILVPGPGTFLHQLLERLGAANVFADAPLPYPQVGLEEIVGRRPEVIVELQSQEVPVAVTEGLRRDWEVFPRLPAIRNGRIHVVAGDYVLIPGPRLPLLYRDLATVLGAPP